jgi:hypothetical protein
VGYGQLRSNFSARSFGNSKEVGELFVSISFESFGDIGWDRDGRASNLVFQTIIFSKSFIVGDFVDIRAERHTLLPDFEVLKLFDSSHNSSFYS